MFIDMHRHDGPLAAFDCLLQRTPRTERRIWRHRKEA
jgi:hypothetical protein